MAVFSTASRACRACFSRIRRRLVRTRKSMPTKAINMKMINRAVMENLLGGGGNKDRAAAGGRGNAKGEAGALAGIAADLQGPAVGFHDAPADREAQTRAVIALGGVEGFEDARQVIRRDAPSVVLDQEFHGALCPKAR